jgi:hypothetical protein
VTDCVLHIGVEKTGSTSIQFSLAKSRPRLLAAGVLYPESLGERNQIKAYAYASQTGVDELKSPLGLTDPAAVQRFRANLEQQLAREIAAKKPRRLCVSNEHCSSRLLLTAEIERLASLLRRHCASIKVVVYLRAQADALRSAYSTYVKTGGAGPFRAPSPEEIDKKYAYDVILDRWASVFGDENIEVRIFDRAHLADGDVVTDFFTRLGVGVAGMTLEREMNKSLGCRGMEFLRRFNGQVAYTIGADFNALRGNIQEIVEDLPGDTPFAGDAEILDAFDAAMAPGNERVRARYLPGTPGPLFEPAARTAAAGPEVTADDLVAVMAHVWEAKQKQVIRLRARLEKVAGTK